MDGEDSVKFSTAHFWNALDTEDLNGSRFRLLKPLMFFSAELQRTVVAPAGFETDFSSIPRGLWNVFPKTGPYDYAAVIHDAGYEGRLQDVGGKPFPVTKQQADRLFLEGMEARKVGKVRRTLMYWAVSKFGRGNFDRKQAHA
jgi:hypothetical protein